ncbi:Golgi transport complex subunit 6 [Malassezia cuniculi]|uniref:Golgi transport complex subunit 6 n=1 Tax=Malassezia cuniculi TaxID=948313 RepID=A0AAF0JDJ7_9BASI|nr:Golgi transport complex subunit 6 [Malassezia cuniculi]
MEARAPAAVSARVRLSLTAPYDAATARAALDTLERMYASAAPATVPAPAPAHAPANPDGTRPGVSQVDLAALRSRVATDTEKEANAATRAFIDELAALDEAHAAVCDVATLMQTECADVLAALDRVAGAASSLQAHAATLEEQRLRAVSRHDLAEGLLGRMTLSAEEQRAVYDASIPTDTRLFDVMDRLNAIRDDSVYIDAASDDVRSVAGDDIRRAAAAHLDAAYRRLERWCALELRQQPQEGTAAGTLLREALARLHAREDLFRGVIRVFCDMRSEYLPTAFVKAVQTGSSGARPIEVHAHDAPRYVADMLAWIHQALAGERELVTSMLGRLNRDEEQRRIGERHIPEFGATAFSSLVSDILGRNIAGCCRPLRSRIAHTLQAQHDSVTALRLDYVLRFYHLTMSQTLGEHAALSAVLKELSDAAHGAFVRALERRAAVLEDVGAGVATLRELLAERARHSGDDDDVLADLRTYFVRPLYNRARRQDAAPQWALSSWLGRRAAPIDTAATTLNALDPLLGVLRSERGLADEYNDVRADASRLATALVDAVYAEMLASSGIAALDTSKAKLEAFLASPELLIPQSLGALSRPAIRTAVHRAARARLSTAYADAYAAAADASSLPKPAQVGVLLDVADSPDISKLIDQAFV